LRWLGVWTRVVVVPAWRRALAAWLGLAIVAAVVFGPTAMHPSDLTGLALHDPGVGLALGVTWLLVFVPTARVIVRAAPAAYLGSLPGDPRAARLVAAGALVASSCRGWRCGCWARASSARRSCWPTRR
jgi:hypothetical protein